MVDRAINEVDWRWPIPRAPGRRARAAKRHQPRANPDKKLGGADAIHLAATVRLGCNYLMTHDKGFPLGRTVNGVEVIRPAEVWPRTLFDEINDASWLIQSIRARAGPGRRSLK
jgi:hypothetical protein